jgi:hypothetical protein
VNLLIIGGLFVLAVVAILGAILLSRGETNGSASKSTDVTGPPEQTNLISRSGPAAAPAADSTTQAAQTAYLAEPGAGTSYTPPPSVESAASYAPTADRLAQPLLNGQFHELAGEIRTLHQQAWQLEQRLSALSEMINQVERSQGSYAAEEGAARRSPSDSTAG